MGRKAGIISIDLVAGTAQFQADMERAKAKVREFGTHSVSGVQAASGAIRTLEGNVTNNVRAVERFLVTSLKLGPVLQTVFPLVGGLAFLGMVDSIGSKIGDTYAQLRDAPEKLRGSYAALN